VANLPAAFEGFTFLHLSDLHDKRFGPGQRDLLALIVRDRFDAVALTGDFIQYHQPQLVPALELVAALREWPIFFVNGNHEWHAHFKYRFREQLLEAGVRILKNRAEAMERGRGRLWIAGVDDPVTGRMDAAAALGGTDDGSPVVLLAHAPLAFPAAVQAGVALMLAGHTHGGQVRLPVLGSPYVSGMGFFPRWDYGMFREGRTTLIVSAGLGETRLPIRINSRPEIAFVTLRTARVGAGLS
jgi:hypothetical protein